MSLNYRADPFWTTKKFTPAQLQCHDVSLKDSYQRQDQRLEIDEVLSSNLIPEVGFGSSPRLQDKWARARSHVTRLNLSSRIEEQNLLNALAEYEWLSEARLRDDGHEDNHVECRWIHVSSKFRDNLTGIFIGMSDWSTPARTRKNVKALRLLEQVTTDQERFSKHGKIFAPFCAPLTTTVDDQTPSAHQNSHLNSNSNNISDENFAPILISVPFLDWTVHPDKDTPALRFQIDEREDFYSTRASSHPMRSLLQYYYRLEDTSERDREQVFAKHRPWYTDRDLDLRVRRWYGHYPSGMTVDELWILVIDRRHIVSFSANQSWKARWPPLQLSSRIWELSFRSLRERFRNAGNTVEYSSVFHAVACLHGAVGLMHRSFWADLPLPCTERYGGYFSHLRYRIYRAPSTRLVMELLQIQDELNIINYVIQQQQQVLAEFHELVAHRDADHIGLSRRIPATFFPGQTAPISAPDQQYTGQDATMASSSSPPSSLSGPTMFTPLQSIYSHSPTIQDLPAAIVPTASTLDSPVMPSASLPLISAIFTDLHSKLRLEKDDLSDLLTSTNDLLTRTIQLVNIRMEDHGQAILVFTVVTVVFLPLSFMTSFFGMNTQDIRNLDWNQGIFWACALSLTAIVVALSGLLAFYGGRVKESLADWRGGYIPYHGGRGWIPRLLFGGAVASDDAQRSLGGNRGGGKRRKGGQKQREQPQHVGRLFATTKHPRRHASQPPGRTLGFSVLGARKVDGINIEKSRPG